MGRTSDARVALLERLVDHAPTFPPASLPVPDALAEDARAGSSPHSFVLARLVWPASRLGELRSSARAISAILDAPLIEDAHVEAVESPVTDGLQALSSLAHEVYVEVPLDDTLEERLDAIVSLGLRAKVRCGGATTPPVAQLARFVRACRERALPFKATAGLHHAVREDGEHGFLNLLAASVLGDEEDVLAETDRDAFHLDRHALAWRDRSAGAAELAAARRDTLASIGSCSFFEPVEELEALGVLPL